MSEPRVPRRSPFPVDLESRNLLFLGLRDSESGRRAVPCVSLPTRSTMREMSPINQSAGEARRS
jgi:hypothetical protein